MPRFPLDSMALTHTAIRSHVHFCIIAAMDIKRERVFDFPGGPLQIVNVGELASGHVYHCEKQDVVECLPLAHGMAIPAGIKLPLLDENEEPFAELKVGVLAGRPVCIGVQALAGHELTVLALRRFPIAKLVKWVVALEAVRVVRTDEGLVGEHYIDASSMEDESTGERFPTEGLDRGRQELLEDLTTGRRRTITPEFLQEVASVYRDARATGQSTQRAIQERWPTSEANARRWVALAREHELLGKAPPRRGRATAFTTP